MENESTIQQFLRNLPIKQQTLDFDDSSIWQELDQSTRQHCCDAIASLIHHVIVNSLSKKPSLEKDNQEHE